jgi:nitrogen-specific signal transduction histidine kinase
MKFEDAGRAVDRELEKLRKFLHEEIRPETRVEMAQLLRRASDRLTKLADRLEKAKSSDH